MHGGEGLALRQYPDGRRVLFLAHESAPMCVSIIDVSKPDDPKVITQIPVNEKKGLTFARGLRSILRHDPDKIMVG